MAVKHIHAKLVSLFPGCSFVCLASTYIVVKIPSSGIGSVVVPELPEWTLLRLPQAPIYLLFSRG